MSDERNAIGTVLITEEEIRNKAKELGAQISKDYEGQELIVVGCRP